MQQIKIFKGVENDLAALEAEVNRWLVQSDAQVRTMFGNISPQTSAVGGAAGLSKSDFPPSDVLLVVLYETSADT